MREALEQIAKGEGRYSRDPLTHASNTIEDMTALARAALDADRGASLQDGRPTTSPEADQ